MSCLSWNFENPAWIKLKTHHKLEKSSYYSLLVVSNSQFFPESQFGDGKSALCWKMPFSRSLLPCKQGPNVWGKSLITSEKPTWNFLYRLLPLASPFALSTGEREEFQETFSKWFPQTAFSQGFTSTLLVSGHTKREESQTLWGAHKGNSLGMERPLH